MRALAFLGIVAGIVVGAGTLTTPADAGPITYLSRTGGGSTCSQATPCSSMNTAIAVAVSGGSPSGQVICLDQGDYSGGGTVTITFAITISCGDGLWVASHSVLVINPPAGADVVIDGFVSDVLSTSGDTVQIFGQGSVHLRRTRISHSQGPFAINFQPTGSAKLVVADSFFYNYGTVGISGAINMKPASGVTANVTIERTRIENNRFGIIADGTGGGIIRGVVRDSTIADSAGNGITVSTLSSNVVLLVENTTVSGSNFGLAASGSNAGMLVRNSSVVTNATGLFSSNGGALLSYGNNSVNGNTTTDGAFTGSVSQK